MRRREFITLLGGAGVGETFRWEMASSGVACFFDACKFGQSRPFSSLNSPLVDVPWGGALEQGRSG